MLCFPVATHRRSSAFTGLYLGAELKSAVSQTKSNLDKPHMSHTMLEIERMLEAAFVQRIVVGVITSHDCEECLAIRQGLAGKKWAEVPNAFAETFSDCLALLSPDAFNAYLPVWLRAAIHKPDGEAATMVAINLSNTPSQAGFTPAQAQALIAAVEYLVSHSFWGADDLSHTEHLEAVKAIWRVCSR